MTIRRQIVWTLLRVYPRAWRGEYGPELTDILLACSLDVRTISDVFWNGLWQRTRVAEPSTRLGLIAMLVIFTGFVWNIVAPSPAGHGLAGVLEESSKTLPTVIVKLLASEVYVLFLVGCGCWTYLRFGSGPSRSGLAAVKTTFIAGTPVMLIGALMWIGALDVVVVSPPVGLTTTFVERGLTYTYYTTQQHSLTPLAVVAAPIFHLPQAWIWGWVGGKVGRGISRARQSLDKAEAVS